MRLQSVKGLMHVDIGTGMCAQGFVEITLRKCGQN